MSFRSQLKNFVHSYMPFLLPVIRCGVRYGSIIVSPQRRRFQMNLWRVKWLDWRHGTNFGDRLYWDEIGTTKERANDYSPSPLHIMRTLKKIGVGKQDAIADLGCGKGYAMYLIAQFRPAMCGGGRTIVHSGESCRGEFAESLADRASMARVCRRCRPMGTLR